tara:strand:+ start:78 stop:209 length:132 start_codon:yes stop_codon:yes gene_type:complete
LILLLLLEELVVEEDIELVVVELVDFKVLQQFQFVDHQLLQQQ